MTEVNFEPIQSEQTGPSVSFVQPENSTPSVSTAEGRAQQFHQGLSPVLPHMSLDDIHAAISSGQEDNVRQSAAMGMDAANAKLQLNTLRLLGQVPDPSDEAVKKATSPLTPTDPKTVAELAWGQHFMDQVHERAFGGMADTTYAQAQKDYPRVVEDIKRRAGIVAAQNQYIQKYSQDAEDNLKKQTGLFGGWQRLAGFVPGVSEIEIRHRLAPVLPGLEKILGGEYMAEASRRLLSMPFPEFTKTIDDVFGPWVKENPEQAQYVLGQLLNQSTSDRYLQDFQTAMDISSIPGTGAVFKGVAKVAGRFASGEEAAKEVLDNTAAGIESLKWTGTKPPELTDIPPGWWAEQAPGSKEWYLKTTKRAAEGAGDAKEAGILQAGAEIKKPVETPKSAVDALTSNFRLDLDNWTSNIGHGGQELANRIVDKFRSFDTSFRDMLSNLVRVETLSDVQAGNLTSRAIEKVIKNAYKGPHNSVADVQYKGLEPTSNTYQYELHLLDPNQQAWPTKIQAEGAKKFIDNSATAVRDGMGWKLIRTIKLDENLKAISDLIATTEEGQLQKIGGPFGYRLFSDANPVIAAAQRYRTPKEVLSIDENMQRELATHSPVRLLGLSMEELKPLSKLPKGLPFTSTRKMWRQFQQAVEHSKHMTADDGIPGRWFKDGQEMDDFYLRNFNRDPSDAEKQAYLATVRNIELERAYNTIRLYSNKAKWGAEQHRIYYYDKDGKKAYSDFFEGRIERDIQGFHVPADATIYVQTGKGEGVVYRSGVNNPIMRKIQKGELQAVQIYNPDFRPLSNFGKTGQGRIQWVISDKFETQPLDWANQIPRRGGGHFVYDYNYYIKQAKVASEDIARHTLHWYEGDTTIMPISIRQMGNDIVKHLNNVRTHLLEGREEAAEQYHKTSGLPFSWKQHRDWYNISTEGGVYKPAMLSMKEPIHLVPKDKLVADIDEDGLKGRYGKYFRDSTREGNPARQMQVQFTGERDARELLNTVKNDGTRDNPLLQYQPANFADPIHTMNRAMQRAVNSIYMQDMKNYSMKHWLKQAVPYMDVEGADKLSTVMSSPAWYFGRGLRWLKGHENSAEVWKLMSAKHQMDQFIGTPSKLDTMLHSTTQFMADMLYGVGGERIVPSWLLGDVRDPAAYLRSAIVHMKLGLFNPASFFVQASTHLNIWGIAGARHAAPGAAALFVHTLARANPAHIGYLAKRIERMGWRPGEVEEAFHELMNRGFTNIGHTHAFVDAPYQTKVIKTKYGAMLDAGHAPFREGAQSVRTAAWYTAYHEWRNGSSWTQGIAHATGKLSKQDWDRVLARASDLDHNMSRAANSQIQSGFMSFPMQFQTYHLRLIELMTGKRLTRTEKLRLFATASLAYGLPFGGLALFGGDVIPVYHHGAWTTLSDYWKQTAQENGYKPNDHFLNDVLQRGLPDAMLGQALGEQYNIAERWGPGKFDAVGDLLRDNISFWNMATGATGSTLANVWANAHPLIKGSVDWITGHSDDYPMTADDFLRPLQEISSVNNIAGFIQTVNTGQIWSKNGKLLGDVSAAKWRQAIMRYVVGLTPQRLSDMYSTYEWDKQEKSLWNEAEGRMITELHHYWDDLNNNDPQSAADHWKRAQAEAQSVGMPLNVKTRIMNQAATTYNKPLVDTVEQKHEKLLQSKGQQQ